MCKGNAQISHVFVCYCTSWHYIMPHHMVHAQMALPDTLDQVSTPAVSTDQLPKTTRADTVMHVKIVMLNEQAGELESITCR